MCIVVAVEVVAGPVGDCGGCGGSLCSTKKSHKE